MTRQNFNSMRNWLAMSMLMLAALNIISACQTLGYGDVEIDTVRKSIVVSNAELRGANLLLQDLIRNNAISQNQAQSALDKLNDAHQALQDALRAVDVNGDPLTAETGHERATRSLSLALAILAPLLEDDTE
jgi:hypothetical protein